MVLIGHEAVEVPTFSTRISLCLEKKGYRRARGGRDFLYNTEAGAVYTEAGAVSCIKPRRVRFLVFEMHRPTQRTSNGFLASPESGSSIGAKVGNSIGP